MYMYLTTLIQAFITDLLHIVLSTQPHTNTGTQSNTKYKQSQIQNKIHIDPSKQGNTE